MADKTTQRQWALEGNGDFSHLHLKEDAPMPKVGDEDVLVKSELDPGDFADGPVKAVSLNFRDLMIARGTYPMKVKEALIPGSDSSGVVVSVGSKVTKWKSGDRVMPIFTQTQISGPSTVEDRNNTLGGAVDGVMRQFGSFNQEGLVKIPDDMTDTEAACLPCAGVTAWNALNGLKGKELKKGEWVLTQGTGGVSIFALQIAKAAGANVVSTTSSSEKGERLKSLGADHIINYRSDEDWGTSAKKLTGGRGFDHIVEVGGPGTIDQSLKAIAPEGVISMIGALDVNQPNQAPVMSIFYSNCIARGIMVGSREHLEDLTKGMKAGGFKPVIDEKVFKFDQVREAYEYMGEQKHFGKVCIVFG